MLIPIFTSLHWTDSPEKDIPMAGIYKYGHPADKDRERAVVETLAAIRESGDDDPIQEEASIVQTDAHREAGEYLVRIVTGYPEPEPEPAPEPDEAARREQLLTQMQAIQAEIDQMK